MYCDGTASLRAVRTWAEDMDAHPEESVDPPVISGLHTPYYNGGTRYLRNVGVFLSDHAATFQKTGISVTHTFDSSSVQPSSFSFRDIHFDVFVLS